VYPPLAPAAGQPDNVSDQLNTIDERSVECQNDPPRALIRRPSITGKDFSFLPAKDPLPDGGVTDGFHESGIA
jgi:hypothetical protein